MHSEALPSEYDRVLPALRHRGEELAGDLGVLLAADSSLKALGHVAFEEEVGPEPFYPDDPQTAHHVASLLVDAFDHVDLGASA